MYDMIKDDLIKLYPKLGDDFQIRIVELMDHVLSTYDRKISLYTADQFKRAGGCTGALMGSPPALMGALAGKKPLGGADWFVSYAPMGALAGRKQQQGVQ